MIVASVCDVVSIVGGDAHEWSRTWFKGGSYALIVGTAVLLLAVATGIVERNLRTVPGSRERAGVNRHAVVMSVLGVVCVVDLVLRNSHFSSAERTPVVVLVFTLAALALTVVGGELGGRLVYRGGIAVGGGSSSRPDVAD